jgi:hypothetical protein
MFLVSFGLGIRSLSIWYTFHEHVLYFRERVPYHRFILIWYVFRLDLVRVAAVNLSRSLGFEDAVPRTTFSYHVPNLRGT